MTKGSCLSKWEADDGCFMVVWNISRVEGLHCEGCQLDCNTRGLKVVRMVGCHDIWVLQYERKIDWNTVDRKTVDWKVVDWKILVTMDEDSHDDSLEDS